MKNIKSYEFFESLLPNDKQWYTTHEVASIMCKSDQYIRDCFATNKLLCHAFNAKAKKGKEKRKGYIVSRKCLVLFLMETANYDVEEFAQRFKRLMF